MKRMIVKSLEVIAWVLMGVMVLFSAVAGAGAGGFFGFLGGLLVGGVIGVMILGTLFLVMDIADNTRRVVELLERQDADRSGAPPAEPAVRLND